MSVVIPTLNAGPHFARVLDAIKRQERVATELMIVDSGSIDETCNLAAAAGARVERLARDEFGHGRAREHGMGLATFDVVVLLVQDAVVLGTRAFHQLATELHADQRLAAVSARQVARSDADLYAAFLTWSHHQALWAQSGRRAAARRAAITVDNVCAAIRRSAWHAVRFADVGFAEDVDFGARACASGWRIALSRSAAVAHSHTRDAVYHLRRNIAERIYVAPIVGDGVSSRAAGEKPTNIMAAGHALIPVVQGALSLAVAPEPTPLSTHLRDVVSILGGDGPRVPASGELRDLEAFLISGNGEGEYPHTVKFLRHDLIRLLDAEPVREFARATKRTSSGETSAFVAKVTASVIGRAIGDSLRNRNATAQAVELLQGV